MILSVILLSVLMILLFTFKYDQASGLWQQLKLASEFESDPQDTDSSTNLPYNLACNTVVISGLVNP